MTGRFLKGPGRPAEPSAADRDPNRALRRLRWAILLNSLFIALELGAGFAVNSLALLGDAWHNFTDVLGLGIAWFAVRQVRRPADSVRTFGYHRAGILAALGNSVFLGVVTVSLLLEAVNVLMERIRRELQDRFRIGHTTIQLEATHPASTDPLPIRQEGEAVRQ